MLKCLCESSAQFLIDIFFILSIVFFVRSAHSGYEFFTRFVVAEPPERVRMFPALSNRWLTSRSPVEPGRLQGQTHRAGSQPSASGRPGPWSAGSHRGDLEGSRVGAVRPGVACRRESASGNQALYSSSPDTGPLPRERDPGLLPIKQRHEELYATPLSVRWPTVAEIIATGVVNF